MNYSIIVPHKNAPELLQRCIASIPQRDDVQIIVVDDNSDERKKPDVKRKGVEVILLDSVNSNGAGHARNVGLSHAKGKWILFADCDDYYCDGFLSVLDKYKDQNLDVVYYHHYDVYGKEHRIVISIDKETWTDDEAIELKFRRLYPWNKMVCKSFINKYNIHFEECINGNDLFFTYQVAFFSKEFVIDPSRIYCYYHNPNSLTRNKKNSDEYYLSIFHHKFKCKQFVHYIGHAEWHKPLVLKFIAILYKKGGMAFLQSLKVYIQHYSELKKNRYEFVNYFSNCKI